MKKSFLTGLVILLPVAVTFFVLGFMLDLLTAPFLKLVSHMLERYQELIPIFKSTEFVTFIARILIILLFCLLILILGVLGRWFLFKVFLNWGNALLMKIPFFRSIYHTAKDLINSIISMDERKAFVHPLMVRFPFKKSLAVGFLSGIVPPECQKVTGKKLVPVFLPTAPHALSGFLIFAKESETYKIKMTNEETIKFILSCGVITPESPSPKNEKAKDEKKST
jgi:uncharacterized membrane protein